MNFKSTLFPGVKTMTSTLRVRPPRDRVSSARKKQQSSIFSSKISELNQRITNWRVSPVTGQLERRCRRRPTKSPLRRLIQPLRRRPCLRAMPQPVFVRHAELSHCWCLFIH